MSALAPFTALLVGAGVGQLARATASALVLAPLAIAAGIATELYVVDHDTDRHGLGRARW